MSISELGQLKLHRLISVIKPINLELLPDENQCNFLIPKNPD